MKQIDASKKVKEKEVYSNFREKRKRKNLFLNQDNLFERLLLKKI